MTWRGVISPLERLYACIPYILPMAGASVYGYFLYEQFPPIKVPFIPFLHISLFLKRGILPGPLGELSVHFFVWFGLFLFVVRNQRLKHFIRFNTAQAILIDVALELFSRILELFSLTILPSASTLLFDFGQVLNGNNKSFLELFFGSIFTTVFLAATAISIYLVFQSIRGKYAEFPIISDAAYNITRY
jgi:uncharacterized membrane protein